MTQSLTKEQKDFIPIVRDEWIKVGLCTDPANRPEAERGIALAYLAANRTPPKTIIWCESPLAGAIAASQLAQVWDQVRAQVRDQVVAQVWTQVWTQVSAQVGDQVGDQVRDQVRDQVSAQVWTQVRAQVWAQVRDQAIYGQHDAGWLSQFDFFKRVGLDCVNRLEGLSIVARNAGWWWAFSDTVVITERPVSITRNSDGKLHRLDEPAILYPDGFGVWVKDGVRVEEPNPLERMSVI